MAGEVNFYVEDKRKLRRCYAVNNDVIKVSKYMGATSLAVYNVLVYLSYKFNGELYPTLQTIGDYLNVSADTVGKCIPVLESFGLIKTRRGWRNKIIFSILEFKLPKKQGTNGLETEKIRNTTSQNLEKPVSQLNTTNVVNTRDILNISSGESPQGETPKGVVSKGNQTFSLLLYFSRRFKKCYGINYPINFKGKDMRLSKLALNNYALTDCMEMVDIAFEWERDKKWSLGKVKMSTWYAVLADLAIALKVKRDATKKKADNLIKKDEQSAADKVEIKELVEQAVGEEGVIPNEGNTGTPDASPE